MMWMMLCVAVPVVCAAGAAVAGLGSLKGVRACMVKGRRGLLAALLTLMAILAFLTFLFAESMIQVTEPVTLLTYGLHHELSAGHVIQVKEVGAGLLPGGMAPVEISGGWQVDAGGALWNGDDPEPLQNPESLTLLVPAGTGRWISFETRADGGQVLVMTGDSVAMIDTLGNGGRLRAPVPDSAPEVVRSLRLKRLALYALLMIVEGFLIGWLIRRERKHGCSEKKQRNGAVDFYRALFMAVLFCFHFRIMTGQTWNRGYLGTEFFFLVSGWMLMAHFDRAAARGQVSLKRYILGRIRRVWPFFFFVWLVVLGINLAMGQIDLLQYVEKDMGALLMLQAAGAGNGGAGIVGGADWYLSAMLLSSAVIYALLIRDRQRFLSRWAPFGAAAILGWLMAERGSLNVTVLAAGPLGLMRDGFWRALAEMSLGCILCAAAGQREGKTRRDASARAWAAVAELMLLILILCCCLAEKHQAEDLLTLVLMAALVWMTMTADSYLTRLLSNPVSHYLGKLAMPVYLLHQLVMNQVLVALPWLDTTRALWASAALTVGLAAVTMPLVEWVTGAVISGWERRGKA